MKNVLIASFESYGTMSAAYNFKNKPNATKLCCLGLSGLLDINFDILLILLTKESKKNNENDFRCEAEKSGVEIRIVEISYGKSAEDIWRMIDQIAATFNNNEEFSVFLDISNGPMYFPLLSLASLAYLESSGRAKLKGIYYGNHQAMSVGDIKVFDLTPLIKVIKEFYGYNAFEDAAFHEQSDRFLKNNSLKRESDGHKVLISGMGASFGLLYSAIRHIRPDFLIVITSSKFSQKAIEACNMADFNSDKNLHIIEMLDVFRGFNEAPELVEAVWPLIQNATSLVISLTGGTTAMQWVMQSIYERSHAANISVERVAFVDPRPSIEQQKNPWHLGELIEIEKIVSSTKKNQ